MVAATTTTTATDGRAARAGRTRAAVVDAMLALIEEGDLRPTAQRVAERAGVSLRSVFQHFDQLDELHAAVADRQVQRVLALARPVPRTGPLDVRIDAFVAQRARILEAISPVRRSAVLAEPWAPEIARRLSAVRQRGRREVELVFAPELERLPAAPRRELLDALAVAASWPTWEALRAHHGLAPAAARRVVARTVRALLEEAL
ncbi:MAG TPA: TetR/AcrR family transcriptional regulator [Dehalococcoidia bacterium]|nr:TetR/AcrR family transcriptional regulator [Dehalococcoidia bacterium]